MNETEAKTLKQILKDAFQLDAETEAAIERTDALIRQIAPGFLEGEPEVVLYVHGLAVKADAAQSLPSRQAPTPVPMTPDLVRIMWGGESARETADAWESDRTEIERLRDVQEELVAALHLGRSCSEHADNCCLDWCSECQKCVENIKKVESVLAKAGTP